MLYFAYCEIKLYLCNVFIFEHVPKIRKFLFRHKLRALKIPLRYLVRQRGKTRMGSERTLAPLL